MANLTAPDSILTACNGYTQTVSNTGYYWLYHEDTRVKDTGMPPTPSGWIRPSPYTREIKEGAYDGPLVEYNFHPSPMEGSCEEYSICCEHGIFLIRRRVANDEAWATFRSSSKISALETRALLSVNDKLKNAAVDLGTAFGERRETIGMTLGALETVVKGIRAAKRLDWRALTRLFRTGGSKSKRLGKMVPYLKSPFQMWLAYQYGWSPLLGDVYNAVERLSSDDGMFTDRYRYGATGRADDKWKDVDNGVRQPLVSNAGLDLVTSHEDRARVLTRVDGYVSSAGWRSAAQWGLTNPALVAWELLPFSFVLDWFIPIGSYLSQLDASLGMEFLGGSTTVTCEQKGKYDVSAGVCQNAACGYRKCIGSPRAYRLDYRRFVTQRVVLSTWPMASFPDVLGLLDLHGCSGKRVVNAISLAITNLV